MYTVTYSMRSPATGETVISADKFTNELDAVRTMDNAELYANMELISYSDNIDRSKYRY